MEETTVVIVGAGPAGLATAACLSELSVPYIVVEREDCSAPLWRRCTYDRLKLHLAKEFCALPRAPFPADAPTYVPRDWFIDYLDDYVARFGLRPRYRTAVESAVYDEGSKRWAVAACHAASGATVEYTARFLVVATGENSAANVPAIAGMESFTGEAIHSSSYKSGGTYAGRRVLVVGSGNSGMEIAYDLASHGADTSILIRSPVHVMTKELIRLGMTLSRHLPVSLVDRVLVRAADFVFGDLSRHGIVRPKMGPLLLKAETGRSAVIDVGTVGLIKKGTIKVFRGISKVLDKKITFEDGRESSYDVIVFATGYKSTAHTWLKDGESTFNSDGFPRRDFPNHWRGENGLYCAGLAKRGLSGISMDARNIANHIKSTLYSMSEN